MKKYFLIVLIGFFVLSCWSFCLAQEKGKEITVEVPKAVKVFWKGTGNVFQKIINIWDYWIMPAIKYFFQGVKSFLIKVFEQKKPEVEKEFEKETQEMKEDIPKVGKSLWQRFRDLFK